MKTSTTGLPLSTRHVRLSAGQCGQAQGSRAQSRAVQARSLDKRSEEGGEVTRDSLAECRSYPFVQLSERLKEAQEKGLAGDGAEPTQEAKETAQPLKNPSPKLKDEDVRTDEAEPPLETEGKGVVEEKSEATPRSPDPANVEAPPSASKEVTPAPFAEEKPESLRVDPVKHEIKVVEDGKGVGDSMVEDEKEQSEAQGPVKEDAVPSVEMLQANSLDSEVADEITQMEFGERTDDPSSERKTSPPLTSAGASKIPPSSRSKSPEPADAPLASEDQDTSGSSRRAVSPIRQRGNGQAVDTDRTTAKRSREDDDRPALSKRLKASNTTPLPRSLSHLVHPPTSNVYITNLRRPLLIPALHDYLLPARHPADLLPSAKGPFASADYPGLWLSGVKDHAYATYPSVEDALETAEKIEGVVWPEDTGEKLHVEFIPDEQLKGLVEREEFAWANGRQKLMLNITDTDDGARFELSAAGNIGGSRNQSGRGSVGDLRDGSMPQAGGPGPRGMPLSGANSIGAPTGPSRRVAIRGRGGLPLTGGPGRAEMNDPGPGMRPGMAAGAGRLVNPMKRTRIRPNLFYKEGPGGES